MAYLGVMQEEKITLEVLARMIQRGLDDMVKKDDFLFEINSIKQRLSRIEQDMKDVRYCLDGLDQEVKRIHDRIDHIDSPADIVDLQLRVGDIEKKLGIEP